MLNEILEIMLRKYIKLYDLYMSDGIGRTYERELEVQLELIHSILDGVNYYISSGVYNYHIRNSDTDVVIVAISKEG